MKKVLLLTHEYYPFAGGVARYCYNLFKNFAEDRYIVMTDCPLVHSEGNKIHKKLLTPLLWPHWLFGLWSVMRVVKKNNIEIIFTPNILPLGSITYFIKKIFGIPYIISLHGLDINLALEHKASWTKKILINSTQVICNTKYTANLIKDFVPAEKVNVIYPSVDISAEHLDVDKIKILKQKYNITDETVILTVGRLVARKGQARVIEALKNLSDLQVKYFIIGDGPDKDLLSRQIHEAHLENKVFLLDRITDDEVKYFYKLADIFAMPHQSIGDDVEGFGIVFLEAATFHLPIIAGSGGGVQEIFTGHDDVIYADDPLALSQALKELIDDKEKRLQFGQQAYLCSQYFQQIAQDNIKLLAKILS